MRVWTHNQFQGHWSVGTAAVVVAPDQESAKDYLDLFLAEAGLPECDASEFKELLCTDGQVVILCDGEY